MWHVTWQKKSNREVVSDLKTIQTVCLDFSCCYRVSHIDFLMGWGADIGELLLIMNIKSPARKGWALAILMQCHIIHRIREHTIWSLRSIRCTEVFDLTISAPGHWFNPISSGYCFISCIILNLISIGSQPNLKFIFNWITAKYKI